MLLSSVRKTSSCDSEISFKICFESYIARRAANRILLRISEIAGSLEKMSLFESTTFLAAFVLARRRGEKGC